MINNEQKQLILSGRLGDGYLRKDRKSMSFNCIHKEYIELKRDLSNNVITCSVRDNNGYKKGQIYYLEIKLTSEEYEYANLPLENVLQDLDELGVALWLLDDGSLHKEKHFFNICTHSFDENFQETILIPILNKFNIYPKLMKERKKDGREFTYLYVAKHKGVYDITRILRKYSVDCYNYKRLSEEEYNKWKIFNEKYEGLKIKTNSLGKLMQLPTDDLLKRIDDLIVTDDKFILMSKQRNPIIECNKTVYLENRF